MPPTLANENGDAAAPRVAILRFEAPLHFANVGVFVRKCNDYFLAATPPITRHSTTLETTTTPLSSSLISSPKAANPKADDYEENEAKVGDNGLSLFSSEK